MTFVYFILALLAFGFAALLFFAGIGSPMPSRDPVYRAILPVGIIGVVCLIAGIYSLIS